MDGKRKSEGEPPSQSEVKRHVDLPKPEEDGPYWLYLIRKHHPELETASKNRYRKEGDYWFCDEELGDGFTEEERDADLLPTWKDHQFTRREYFLKRLRDISDHLVSPKRTSQLTQPVRDMKQSDKESVEKIGWSTYSYDLEDILPSYTFLVDLYEKLDGTSQEEDIIPSITVSIPATTEPKRGMLSLNVIDKDDNSKLTTWLSTRKNSYICGMVTVIERETGEQVQLFVGDVSKETKPRIGGGFKCFEPFSVLHYFSTNESYSEAIWSESFLRLSNAGVGFEYIGLIRKRRSMTQWKIILSNYSSNMA
ncbi:MAG: hypothetical protein ACI90V_006688 [Bacillariaceae sp.]|jgi:hypothetical protein